MKLSYAIAYFTFVVTTCIDAAKVSVRSNVGVSAEAEADRKLHDTTGTFVAGSTETQDEELFDTFLGDTALEAQGRARKGSKPPSPKSSKSKSMLCKKKGAKCNPALPLESCSCGGDIEGLRLLIFGTDG